MDGLSEKDYSELIGHLIERLQKHQAEDLIRQIKELETVNVIEKAEPIAAKKRQEFIGQIGITEKDEAEGSRSFKPGKRGKGKLERDAVSEYSSRPMRHEEVFYAAIDILETYLISVPRLFEELEKGLDVDLSKIVWKNEAAEQDEVKAPVEIINSFRLLELEKQAEIEQMIEGLKTVSGKERI